jgi:hypothetical protein
MAESNRGVSFPPENKYRIAACCFECILIMLHCWPHLFPGHLGWVFCRRLCFPTRWNKTLSCEAFIRMSMEINLVWNDFTLNTRKHLYLYKDIHRQYIWHIFQGQRVRTYFRSTMQLHHFHFSLAIVAVIHRSGEPQSGVATWVNLSFRKVEEGFTDGWVSTHFSTQTQLYLFHEANCNACFNPREYWLLCAALASIFNHSSKLLALEVLSYRFVYF